MTSTDEKLKLNLGRDIKTVYDMLLHLSGQLLPGITTSQSLPFDPIQRVVQLHWQHSTMITFLRNQGASLPHVLPQFLLDFEDFKKWTYLQLLVQSQGTKESPDENNPIHALDDSVFEAMSKRAWTDVLLQIYKILVLQRVSILEVNHLSTPEDTEHIIGMNADPLSSNIYSSSEQILIIWLNRLYEIERKVVWKDSKKGEEEEEEILFTGGLLWYFLIMKAVFETWCKTWVEGKWSQPDLLAARLKHRIYDTCSALASQRLKLH
ncbi:hypothetical protein lerEdw1_016787 [Lerista edwardsae]|nr:hypothetical protein lerEdw1_016787 [Lerista edwardsae]